MEIKYFISILTYTWFGPNSSNFFFFFRNPTNVHSTSSEDLLREYGLDFHQLSIHQHQQFPTSYNNSSSNHFVNSSSSTSSQQLNTLLEDLDPFRTTSSSLNHQTSPSGGIGAIGRPQTMITTAPTPSLTSHQPVAPPRVKRHSHQPTQNWTTFDWVFVILFLYEIF